MKEDGIQNNSFGSDHISTDFRTGRLEIGTFGFRLSFSQTGIPLF